MASANVIEWIEENIQHVGVNALEVGSKRYKDHAYLGLREFLNEKLQKVNLLGCDISAGEGVDVVVDITASPQVVTSSLQNRTFDTVFCVSVLEHIPNVFGACRNISSILNTGGALFISVPFIFRYHGYPGDLWRFTPEAVTYLFSDIDFEDYKHSYVTTLEQGERMSLKNSNLEKMNRFLYRPKSREEKIARKEAKRAGAPVAPYSLAPAMINMLGFKR